MFFRFLILEFLIFGMAHSLFAQNGKKNSVIVVANKGSELTDIDMVRLKKIYLGKLKSLPSGEKIMPIDQKGKKIRDIFYKKVVGKPDNEIKAYWAKLIFTGRGNAPRQLQNDRDVIDLVKREQTAIGYISSEHADSNVKVIMRIP